MTRRVLGTWRLSHDLADVLEAHAALGQRRSLRPTDELYAQGEVSSRFFYVLSGLVRVAMLRADGSEVVLEIMGPRTVCGEGAAFDRRPRFSGAAALTAAEVVEFDAEIVARRFGEHPELAVALLRIIGLKQRILAVRLEHLAAREPEERILELLDRLAASFGEKQADGGTAIGTYLSHEQIAAMTGTSRVTVTRTLARLREAGAIEVAAGEIVLRLRG